MELHTQAYTNAGVRSLARTNAQLLPTPTTKQYNRTPTTKGNIGTPASQITTSVQFTLLPDDGKDHFTKDG